MTNCATQTGHGRCCVTPAVKANGLWLCVFAGQRPFILATPTGLEPAASAVTGRRANQLRYGASW